MQDSSPNNQLDWLEQSAPQLSAGFPEKMVLFDCETTGGKATYHRMTEVALLVVEQGKVVDEWQTLLNPRMHIPPEIQRLTGITPALVRDAPDFEDVAERLLEILDGRVLVAHNARFDYSFLKNEFSRLGMAYSDKPLCSVKISRKLFPQHRSHSLSNIIRRYGFRVDNRHRALDDARVIWKFFLKISSQFPEEHISDACEQVLQRPALPMHLDQGEIDKLPKTPGVYYFYDAEGKLLYIGKSVNIRDRVMSHFTQDYRNAKDLEMSALIAHIDFETTPSDFGAQLRESQQIKVLNPYFNRRLRKVMKLYQYQLEADAEGYLRIRIQSLEKTVEKGMEEQFGLFRSRRQAEGRLAKLTEHYFLCQKLCGLQSGATGKNSPCFGFQLKRCLGACCAHEPPEAYNERVHIALSEYRQKNWPWSDAILLEEAGVHQEQPVWHLLNDWRYLKQVRDQDELYEEGFTPATSDSVWQSSSENSPTAAQDEVAFDLDLYQIMVRFLLSDELLQANKLRIIPLQRVKLPD